MKKLIAALAFLGLAAPVAVATSAQASYDCHCHYSPVLHRIVGYKAVVSYKPVLVKSVHYLPIFAYRPFHPCYCYVRHVNPYAPYPDVFVENAHVYVPPTYYYSPYSYVDNVLVHRSYEIGPVVPAPTVTSTVVAVVLP